MTCDSSATAREETSHATETSQNKTEATEVTTEPRTQFTTSNALRRRAQSLINDTSIDPQWRSIIRYALETNDPWLGDLVRRADAGEMIIEATDLSPKRETDEDDSSEEKIEALSEIICGAGDEAAAALFVLMGSLEKSTLPKLLANTAKYLAFSHVAESNLYGMVDAQVAVVEDELLAESTLGF